MAKNTKQIALIQNRHGKVNELPKQLSTGEFGFADDTNQLFIGNGDHPTLKERLNSNTFPYGNVEIVTEFSDIPEIAKYSPKMNGIKVNYPIKLMGTKTLPEVRSGSSIIVNDREVVFEDEVVVKEYDYLLLKYIWTDGRDLDTDTRFINLNNFPEINNKGVGYGYSYDGVYYGGQYIIPTGSSVSTSYLHSVGDNTHEASPTTPQEENILISRNNIINENNYELLPNNIQIQLSGTWYADVGHNPVMIEICAYKGGVMEYDSSTYKYTNVGGEEVIFGYDTQGNPITTLSLEINNLSDDLHVYTTLGYVTINKETGNTTISTTGENSSGNSSSVQITYDIEKIAKKINEECSDVEASIIDDKICLRTFKEILTLEDGNDIDNVNTLEALGFTEKVYYADKLTKRSIQDVLDDRYSIKAFDVMGDGFTDDSEGINLATEILHTFDKSDNKELYFPADTYIVNNNSLNLLSNTHFVGEGIDRTIIKSKSNLQSLLVTVDQQLRKPDNKKYCVNIPGVENTYNARFIFKDNFFKTYGKIQNVIFTCIRYNSSPSDLGPYDWQYIASVHFENGVLPISIAKDNSNAVYHKESFEYYSENSEATEYNSATPVDYINCKGMEMPNQMVWSRHSKEKANKDYFIARKYGWNYGYEAEHPTTPGETYPTLFVDPHRYTFEINNAGTELKIKDNYNNDLIVLYDDVISYMEFPHNIMIEDMTLDVSESSSLEIVQLGHSNDITFKNCKFITKNVSDILNTVNDSKLKDIKFIDCIFEGNNSSKGQIIINGELDGLLITNCEFNDIKNTIVVLNGNENKIKNGIIANNKFTNCGADNIPLISVNENVEYVNVVKSLVEYPYLTNEREVLNRWDGDYNYCDTPNMLNDHNKYVRCTFYQDIYDYVQALYTKYGKNALEVISPDRNIETTNYIKLITGTDYNEHTLSLSATNQTGNVEFNMGKYGDLLVGKDSEIIEDWKPNYPYNLLDTIKINTSLYRCIEKHTSKTYFEKDKWLEIQDQDIPLWRSDIRYNVNDFVIYNDVVYICKTSHTSGYSFIPAYWEAIVDVDTAIVLYKNLDVNDRVIENRSNNDIIFKSNDNTLIVDDSNSEIPYKDRIGDKDNALVTVGYLNDAVNSYVNQKYDVDTINQKVGEEKSSELLLYDFDSTQFGTEVYLEDVDMNVRQLFIPISEQIQAIYPDICEYLPWQNKIMKNTANSYKVGDVVEILNANNNNYEYYRCIADHTCTTISSNEWTNFTNEYNSNYWQLATNDIGEYEGYSSKAFDHVTWYKGDVVRYIRYEDDENGKIYFYICKKDHVATVYYNEEDSLDNDIAKDCWENVVIDASKMIRVFDDEGYTYDIEPSGTLSYSGNYIHLTRYIGGKVYIILPELRYVIDTVPDLKYVSLKLVDKLGREADKWLFDIDDVDLIYRNTNGYTYPLWRPNTTYENGIMVRFNYSNFKCVAVDEQGYPTSYTSSNEHIDLHNTKYWKKLNESGYDYKFHFERDMLERDINGNFYLEDYQYVHNVADHKLYICFYDKNGRNIEILNHDMSKYFEYLDWEPITTYYKGNYIRYNNSIYVAREDFTSGQTFATEVDFGQTEWMPNTQYHREDYVKHDDILYMVQEDYISGSTFQTVINDMVILSEVEAPWKLLSLIEHTTWTANSNFYKNQYIHYNEEVYQVINDYVSSDNFIVDYKNGKIKLIPTQYMQLGRSGELLVKVNYTKGNK